MTNWSERYPITLWVVAALLGPALAGLLSLARGQLPEIDVALVLVLGIGGVAAAGRRLPTLVAATTTALGYNFFWTEPYHSLAIADAGDILTVVLLLVVGAAIGQFSWWATRQQAVANRRLSYLTALRHVADTSDPDDRAATTQAVCDAIVGTLGADRCRLVEGPAGPTIMHPDGSVTREGVPVNVDRNGLPTDDLITIPSQSAERILHFAISAAGRVARPSAEQRQIAVLLAELGTR